MQTDVALHVDVLVQLRRIFDDSGPEASKTPLHEREPEPPAENLRTKKKS
jgi:hypothetical protein